jgi:hypothetical protein
LSLSVALSMPRGQAAQPVQRVSGAIDNGVTTKLSGNVHPLANAQYDQGAAPADLPMNRMVLVLTRSTSQQTALDLLLKSQQDPASPQYRHWLTPQQFGQQFGAADADIQKMTSWLESQGFTIDHVGNAKTFIQFSGTAGQVQQAFRTQIHKYVVNGVSHWANATDPQIPSALSSVVAGVATLYNFAKKPQLVKSAQTFSALNVSGKTPQFTSNGTHALAPADFATIYNINPLYQNGINGSGSTIAVVGRTNINVSDVSSFRSIFGLPANPPQIIVNGTDPGDLGGDEEAEAVLDTSWAGATAPNATVELVVSASTNTSDGVDLSEMYIIDNNLADVMTESFGDCEANYTAAEGTAISNLASQAAAQGITYTVAAGDSGAEGCDDPTQTTAHGPISVNILASTPYTVAVGGTEFNENGNYSTYWNSSNGPNDESALSYIPEDAWNESCTIQQCGRSNAGLWAVGGGVSTIFTKPSWQTALTPNDNARDVPDVALTAAGHDAYLLCLDGSCTPNTNGTISLQGYSGTSAATPSFAGIMALIVQQTGSRQGQADPTLYALAGQEDFASCNASNTSVLPGSSCVFNDVTSGNNAVPGEANYGSANADYQAGVGYDLTTGLGSVNATNLAYAWIGSAPPTSSGVSTLAGFTSPISDNSIVTGLTTFSGWALSQSATIKFVTVVVDGSPVGSATYGLSSPSACATYTSAPGCPNVGWSYVFDTTTVADGSHTLEIQAVSSSGQYSTASTRFTVANWSSADPMTIAVDVPSSSGTPLSGSVGLGGWAIDNIAAISQLAIAIDGVSFGMATYGGVRSDVCAIYPGRAGCPNVGWNFFLDTTLLADGTHTLTVTATSAGGQSSTQSRPFQVLNAAGNPITLDVDQPTAGATFSGPASFYGWALDNNSSVTSVAISIDGVAFGNATYGATRPDVCVAFLGRPGCPNVGWSYLLDTTRLANGTHTLDVTAYSTTHATLSQQFTVSNTTPGNPVTAYIDAPGSLNNVVQGVMQFKGWAISNDAQVTTISLAIDGVPKGVGNYGAARPDVCAVYSGRPGCPNVGWTLIYNTNLLANGQHTLVVTANVTDASGNVTEQGSATSTFTVANWTTSDPIVFSIDSPNSSSGAVSGQAPIGGWAIDSLAAINTVAISVDGTPFGAAVYGGTRSDVCASYPNSPGCPNVGWNFVLDTTLLADGTHTLQVTATSAGGESSAQAQTFQVSNGSSDSVKVDIDSPSAGQSLTGTTTLYGWALDSSGVPVQSVVVLVDGVQSGTASYGTNRPDACAQFPTAGGCPNVGWGYSLNTTAFANGLHTLEVRATASDGTVSTASQTFSVNNSQ